MSTPFYTLRQFKTVPFIGLLLVVFGLSMFPSPAMAKGYSGSGTIYRTDGTEGHFLFGAFNSEATCQKTVFQMIEYLKNQSQWVGESLTYRLYGCGTEFQNGTIYNDIQKISGLKHFMLLHPNFRMLIVSPRGRGDEKNICSKLSGYFQTLLGKTAVCVSPKL